MRRSTTALLLAAFLVALATPTVALDPKDNFFYNSAVADSNNDGRHDLTVCFEAGTPVYTNRDGIMAGMRSWQYAHNIELFSTGTCDAGDTSNVHVFWDSPLLNQTVGCSGQPIAQTGDPGRGYSQIGIQFNAVCPWHWDSNSNPPNTKYDSYTVGFHEMGHAYGLGHDEQGANDTVTIMDPTLSKGIECFLMSAEDAASIRIKYVGIPDTPYTFNANASCAA